MGTKNLAGYSLGQYELRDLLGAGGMGAVYRGYQTTLKRYVAVKVMTGDIASQSGYSERFTREAETSAKLDHPNIIKIYDYGIQEGISYLVMQLLGGGTLAERLKQRTGGDDPLPSLGEVADLLRQLGSALDYAHSQGVIHRDIKPSNVMFDNHGNAYLVDFGIAKLAKSTQGLTASGMVIGTWGYMAPEQWRGGELTAAADQYALAVMVYTLVTGQMPFDSQTPAEMMHRHLTEMPTPPHLVNVAVPAALTFVLERALAKDPDERFPTCTAFAQAFDGAVRGNTGVQTAFFTMQIRPEADETPLVFFTPLSSGVSPSPATNVPSQPVTITVARPIYKYPLMWVAAVVILMLVAVVVLLMTSGKDEPGEATIPGVAQGHTVTSTLDAHDAAVATRDALQALTATYWTPVDTADVAATIDFELTALYHDDLTATAVLWTPAATDTFTPLPTATRTVTSTATNTVTSTATSTATNTATSTATSTATPTDTLTPEPTETATQLPTTTSLPTVPPIPPATHTLPPLPPATPLPAAMLQPTATSDAVMHMQGGWSPVVEEINGVVMVQVPPGSFVMGSTAGDIDQALMMCQQAVHDDAVCERSWWEDELSSSDNTQVFTVPFWIDRDEVTRAQYQACVEAGGCDALPASELATAPDQPVNRVTWTQAQAYCTWRGGRLPTEAEWEYAARGPGGAIFPWGGVFDGTFANHCDVNCAETTWGANYAFFDADDDGYAALAPVSSYPGDVSWVGALDLGGNVREWTSSLYAAYPYTGAGQAGLGARYTLRGGVYSEALYVARAANRIGVVPGTSDDTIGFRCAADYK